MANQTRQGLLLGMGNPLLDITCQNAEEILKKYEMKPNDQILAEEKHKPMYKEMVDKYEVEYTAGGATQNSMRVAQWMLNTPNVISFMGCIGQDKFGQILEKEAKNAGINVRYQYNDKEPTGTCAVVLTSSGANRSLCANLAAANLFNISHLEDPENMKILESALFYYISGFFITVSPDTILKVAKHANEQNKVFSINLSAPFISQFFMEPLSQIIPYADIIFGNETEAATFAKEAKLGVDTIPDIALKISEMDKVNVTRRRMVIITQGEAPIVVAYDGKVSTYDSTSVPADKIIDTNGAGDAFVGGFLSQLIQGKTTDKCIEGGTYAATLMIQRSGVTLPEKCDFNS